MEQNTKEMRRISERNKIRSPAGVETKQPNGSGTPATNSSEIEGATSANQTTETRTRKRTGKTPEKTQQKQSQPPQMPEQLGPNETQQQQQQAEEITIE